MRWKKKTKHFFEMFKCHIKSNGRLWSTIHLYRPSFSPHLSPTLPASSSVSSASLHTGRLGCYGYRIAPIFLSLWGTEWKMRKNNVDLSSPRVLLIRLPVYTYALVVVSPQTSLPSVFPPSYSFMHSFRSFISHFYCPVILPQCHLTYAQRDNISKTSIIAFFFFYLKLLWMSLMLQYSWSCS